MEENSDFCGDDDDIFFHYDQDESEYIENILSFDIQTKTPQLNHPKNDTGQNTNTILSTSSPIKSDPYHFSSNKNYQNDNDFDQNQKNLKIPTDGKNIINIKSQIIPKKQKNQTKNIDLFQSMPINELFPIFNYNFLLPSIFHLNSRPCTVRPDDFQNCMLVNADSSRCQFASKRGMKLSLNVQKFKDTFYKIFTSKKKFRKEYVKEIHNNFLKSKLHLQRMSRDETRSVNLYFYNYFAIKDEILKTLEENKDEIKKTYLSDINE